MSSPNWLSWDSPVLLISLRVSAGVWAKHRIGDADKALEAAKNKRAVVFTK